MTRTINTYVLRMNDGAFDALGNRATILGWTCLYPYADTDMEAVRLDLDWMKLSRVHSLHCRSSETRCAVHAPCFISSWAKAHMELYKIRHVKCGSRSHPPISRNTSPKTSPHCDIVTSAALFVCCCRCCSHHCHVVVGRLQSPHCQLPTVMKKASHSICRDCRECFSLTSLS